MTAFEQKALFRFQIIHPLLDDRLGKGELSRMVREASEREYVIPGSRKTTISESTIWSWYKTYLKTRNIASLVPKNRNDKGRRRKITGETADRLLQFRIENPDIPLTALVKKAEKQGIFTASDTIRMSGIYSFFREHELELDPKAGKDMRRFEAEGVLDLWQSDCMHGPKVLYNGKRITAKLFCLIDDCSRVIVAGKFYPSETAESFLDVLWTGFQNRGLPKKILVDNGSCFRDHRLALGCAALEVSLCFCRPYHPQGKSKIERFWLTVRMQFLSVLDNTDKMTLEQLNVLWARYVDEYNNRPHSALKDPETGRVLSPLERYKQDMRTYRYAPRQMPKYFRYSEKRTVSDARTISFNNKYYQVPIGHAGKRVEIRYFTKDGEIEAFYDKKSLGYITEVDLHFNSKGRRRPEGGRT
jgi:transposase InsO family protein